MATYLMLADKARAFRADPAVVETMTAAGVYELGEPTLGEGESLSAFLAAEEPFDPDAAGARETHFVRLYQQALAHLIG